MNRKDFIKKSLFGSALLTMGKFPYQAFAKNELESLVILHTNDTHSRLEPFPDNDKNFAGMGGIAARENVIKTIRAKEKNVLLVDAGDIFQGTPYFNLFKGEPEIKALSKLGYDCATMGNHDFDLGLDGFLKQLPHANFPFVTSNYDFSRTILKDKTKPYHILQKGNIKIGILGLGVQLYGLVPRDAYGKTYYINPVEVAQKTAKFLKEKKNCDIVICLSHLGYEYSTDKISDIKLAASTDNIDVIIGGHTHTFLDEPTVVKNMSNNDVIINQVGWGGVNLGYLKFEFEKNKIKNHLKRHTVFSVKQTIG
jgi:5'-nucleotidase